jgi:glycerophosphoryl diester phosphodiesterase
MNPLIVAHRGGAALAPENTIVAVRNAVRLGVDTIEIDVLPSRDGQLVVHHDEQLTRTAGVNRNVWDLDVRELQSLDVGRWFAREHAGERVPTLEEVAAELPSGMRLIVDMKHGDERFPGIARRVADFARALGTERFSMLSIRHDFALRVAEMAPGVRPLLVYRAPLATEADLAMLDPLPPEAGIAASLRALSVAMLVRTRAAHRTLYTYNPTTPLELRVALTIGVDGVITDRPDLALELRRDVTKTFAQPMR